MKQVVVLEDSPGRIQAIQRVIGDAVPLRVFDTAPAFVAWLAQAQDVALLALDHHLGPPSAGSGMDAARALAARAPFCPVILHSSDRVGAMAMEDALRDAGWTTERFVFTEGAWAQAYARLVGP